MQYITVEDGIITGHFCGSKVPEGAIEVPGTFQGHVGMKFAALEDDKAAVKPLSKQVAEKILTVPEGWKISPDDRELLHMDEEELDAAFEKEAYAQPGTESVQMLRKSFDRYGNFALHVPDGFVRMASAQPTEFHTAQADGTWKLNTEKLAESVRTERDQKLAETDYLLATDYPITAESLEAVKTYRQALRDVPEQASFPEEVTWPEKPQVEKEATA